MESRDDIIKKLLEEHPIDKIVSFSELDVHEKLSENSNMLVKYTELLNAERSQLDKVVALRDKKTGERYDHYRFHFDKELKPSEIEKYYLPKDDVVMKMNTLVQRQQWRVDFFQMCVKAIDKLSWSMKSFLEALRI
jgi:hypothetical protein